VRKIAVKRLARDEKGQALVIALILLALGGIIIAPLLSYVNTGLVTGGVYERKADELYAADAGVEDAVWKIQQGDVTICPGNPDWPPYSVTVNNKIVDVNISSIFGVGNITTLYRVVSTANGDGSGTEIEAYVSGKNKYGDYSGLLNQILTSQGEIDVANKVILDYPEGSEPYEYYPDDWPTAEELIEFYQEGDIEYEEYYFSTINLNGIDQEKGPLYRDGTLDIKNSSNTPATLTLTGTLYVTGQTTIGKTEKDFTLDLNGQTIFVSDDTTGSQKALIISGSCTIKGPGAIISVGDLEFKPKSQIGGEEGGGPVFIMSVSGTTTLQPSGNIYGSIAGSVEVEVQQGEEPTITYPEGGFGDTDLGFPIGLKYLVFSIASWEVGHL